MECLIAGNWICYNAVCQTGKLLLSYFCLIKPLQERSCDLPHCVSTAALGSARAPGTAWGVETLGRWSPNVLPLPSWDGGTLCSAGFRHWGHCCCSQALALGLRLVPPQLHAVGGCHGIAALAGRVLPACWPWETYRNNLETCSAELNFKAKLSGSSRRLDL